MVDLAWSRHTIGGKSVDRASRIDESVRWRATIESRRSSLFLNERNLGVQLVATARSRDRGEKEGDIAKSENIDSRISIDRVRVTVRNSTTCRSRGDNCGEFEESESKGKSMKYAWILKGWIIQCLRERSQARRALSISRDDCGGNG